MTHSPEPWSWNPGDEFSEHGEFVDATGERICWFGSSEMYYPTSGAEPSQENIERIVACVNACRCIPTPIVVQVIDRLFTAMMTAASDNRAHSPLSDSEFRNLVGGDLLAASKAIENSGCDLTALLKQCELRSETLFGQQRR